jgi:tetratricopeptide (TPR) repeat protein
LRAAYCILWGDLAGGLAYCHRCLDNAKSIHTPFQIMYAHVCIAFIGWKDTKDPECLTALRQSALWFEQDNSLQRTSLVYAMVADAYCEAGDIAHARSFAARAIRRIQKGGDHFGVPWAYRTTARLALKSGSLARAQRSLKKAYWASAVKRSRREHGLTLMLEAEMVMARGEFDQARTLLQTAIADFEAMGAVAFVAEARSLLAQLSIPIIATHAPL